MKLRAFCGCCRDPNCVSCDRQRSSDSPLRSCGQTSRRVQICVVELRSRKRPVSVVIKIVGDVPNIRDARISDVDVREVTPAPSVPGEERLTKAERAPAESATKAKSKGDSPSRTTKPCDQRGSIKRPNVVRTGSPSPISPGIDPAAVVEGSEAPRGIIYPSPSPRINPSPMAVVIRGPSWSN